MNYGTLFSVQSSILTCEFIHVQVQFTLFVYEWTLNYRIKRIGCGIARPRCLYGPFSSTRKLVCDIVNDLILVFKL